MSGGLAIVIVTHNSAHVITELLDSLPAALAGRSADVVVVDNDSPDATVERLAGRTDCRVVRAPNDGYSAGINRGLAVVPEADAVLVLNPDTRLHPGSVDPLIEALAVPGTGIAAPRVESATGATIHSLRREPTLRRALGLNFLRRPALAEFVNDDAAYEHPQVVDWALGAVLLLSRECLERVGPWDESFFLYSEETDYCLRARDLGLVTRYEPRSVVTHIGAQSGQSDAIHAMQIVNRVRLYRRRHRAAVAWAYFAATVASEATWSLRGFRPARFAVRALLVPGVRPPELRASGSLLPR